MPQKHKNWEFLFKRPKQREDTDLETKKVLLLLLAMLLAIGIATAQRASAGDILPRDGVWQGHSSVRDVNGCTPELRADIQSDVEDEVLYSSKMSFDAPFNLDQFNRVWDADVDWIRMGPNLWHGTLVETERSVFGSVTSTTELETQVLSDVQIKQSAVVTVAFSRALARNLGATSPCVIDADITHRRVGP